MGSSSNGRTSAWHAGNQGSSPCESTHGRQPDTGCRAALERRCSFTDMRVRLPRLPLDAPMVKRTITPRFERDVAGSIPARGTSLSPIDRATSTTVSRPYRPAQPQPLDLANVLAVGIAAETAVDVQLVAAE